MRNSGIGGQAVIEGIMMRNKDKYSVGVRKSDGEIAVDLFPYSGLMSNPAIGKIPLVRGVVAFIDSLVIGIKTLMVSAAYFDDEETEEDKKKKASMTEEERKASEAKEARQDKFFMTGVMTLSIGLAVLIFMLVPYFISEVVAKYVTSHALVAFAEAILRVLFFLIYLIAISRMKDIQRTFMYHGAEHKCINCIENGLELNVENVMKSSRFHKRCGTSFLVYVIVISAILLMFIQTDSHVMRIVYRLLLVPVIAGISYELLRIAGKSEGKVVNCLAKPGLLMQRLTTREPDEAQAEVAIAAVEAVFDWKAFLEENFDNE